MSELKLQPFKSNKFPPSDKPPVMLPKGETIVLQADDPTYKRGLVVTLAGRGGYDIAYWFDRPDKLYPAEVKIDDRSITKSGKVVHIGYHPELSKKPESQEDSSPVITEPQFLRELSDRRKKEQEKLREDQLAKARLPIALAFSLGGAALGNTRKQPLLGAIGGFILYKYWRGDFRGGIGYKGTGQARLK